MSISAQPANTTPLAANRILVQWRSGSSLRARQAARSALGARLVGTIHSPLMQATGQGPLEVIELPRGLSSQWAIKAYRRVAGVALAEFDAVVGTQAIANDPYYTSNGDLWGMYSSDRPSAVGPAGTSNAFASQAEQAWGRGYTGSSRSVVGVIDTGIDYTHPDLYLNIWLNPAEIASSLRSNLVDGDADGLIGFRDLNAQWSALRAQGSSVPTWLSDWNGNGYIDAGDLLDNRSGWEDGVDADGNGFIDDLIGWDFFNNSNDPFRASDGDSHGTHVAGTIGALGGNGIGVAGVNWRVQIMPLKFLGPGGGYTSAAISAVNYYANLTTRQDVDFGGTCQFVGTSNSWGGGTYNSNLHSAIITAGSVGNLFVAAAGNSGADNDLNPRYPANYSTLSGPSGSQPLNWEAVVTVAALQSDGSLASLSNWGKTTVDLGAPGVAIISCAPGGGYASLSGTSMATPHVSGAIALYASAYPSATPQQILQALYGSVAATDSLNGKTSSGGRLDVNAMLASISSLEIPLISLAAAPATVAENGTMAILYTFSRTGDLSAPLMVAYSVGGTATAGVDYDGLSGTGASQTISFSAGAATATLAIRPLNDDLVEVDETVELQLMASASYLVDTTGPVIGTITNQPLPAIGLSVAPASVAEDGTGNLVFSFSRSGSTASSLTVAYSVGGSASIGVDYSGLPSPGSNQTITFSAGSATAILTLDPTSDTTVEDNESVELTLLNGNTYTIATPGSVVGTISNDDLPSVSLTVSPSSVNEDGSSNVVYTFSRSAATATPLTVNFTVGGSASADIDYTGLGAPGSAQTVTIAAYSSSTSLVLDPIADSTAEINETISLSLVAGSGYTIGSTAPLTATIVNDDAAPTLTFTAGTDSLSGNGGNAIDVFRLSRLNDCLWSSNPDRITNLQAGVDQIDTPSTRTTAINPRLLGAVKLLDASGIAALLTSKTFSKSGAACFTYADPTLGTRTFLAINDTTAGFNASTDAVLEITGYGGSLGSLAIT